MAAQQLCATFPDGTQMPLMAFGTLMESLSPDEDQVVEIVKNAIDVGYRHLDTARIYNTERAVGRAVREKIQDGVIWRKDIFITTKLWRNSMERHLVVPALKESLEELGQPYVDLFLLHWPTAFLSGESLFPKDEVGKFQYAHIDYLDAWKGMEDCVRLGLTKAIGVSNFNSKQLQRVLDNSSIKPVNHQIECHPYLTNSKMVKFCHDRHISVTAYTPLAGFNPSYREEKGWPTIFTDERILSIAKKYNRTPAQVALRFQLQRGVAVAPKSSKLHRMRENFQALDFELRAEDMAIIESCNQDLRLNAEFPDHPYYPFHEEF